MRTNYQECFGIDLYEEINAAFIGVDIQNDFGLPDGALYVKGSEKIIDRVNNIVGDFADVFWTQDWHPENHCSFKPNGGIWPVHCVMDSDGAKLIDDLEVISTDTNIFKGMDVNVDSYSAFFDNDHKTKTALDDLLIKRWIKKLVICGIATDYCVKFTVLDAIKLGYKVYVYLPGCAGVNVNPGDVDKAIQEMEDAGAIILEN